MFFKVFTAFAQGTHEVTAPLPVADTMSKKRLDYLKQKELDLIDIGLIIINKNNIRRTDTLPKKKGKVYVAPLPGFGYSLNTGLAAVINANIAFYTSEKEDANISSINTSVNYTQLNQFLLPVLSNIWLDDNRYNIQGDWVYNKFPQSSYGVGGHTSLRDVYQINYSNIKIQTAVYRALAPDLLIGPGYTYEYYWNVSQLSNPANPVTDLNKYGYTKTSLSSALTLNFLYDTRRNSINPEGGEYVNISYRPNLTLLGSDDNWQSLVIDLRKYFRIPDDRGNMIALWAYEWFTFGKTPYVLLPNTGGDPYVNTGRGYAPGRFRGKDMLYLEGEYRYKLMRDGLIGGVFFCNLQSFPEPGTNHFDVLYPGFGTGLRFKFNKYSRTNVAVDYAFGVDGSKGFFINLGEVF